VMPTSVASVLAASLGPNKRMQRARDRDKCVLCWPHRRALMRGVMRQTGVIASATGSAESHFPDSASTQL
jgi:hypothetical protein